MKNLLYVGNHLHNSRSNVPYSAVLGSLLEQSGNRVNYTSHKNNKVLRLLEMLYATFVTQNTTELVLIDTYSTQNFYYAFMVSQLCRILKLPYIPVLHGGQLSNRLIASPSLSSMIFNHAYLNVAPSNYMKNIFESHGYTNVKYIPNTIEIIDYPFLIVRDLSRIKLLWVRSFSNIYNPTMAVKVLKALKDLGLDASLCMVGPDTDGSLKEVKDLARRLNVDVKITGKLTKQQWIELSKDFNVFINTTTIDNMPVSVIEAMALGLPVVSTNVGGMPYLIEHGTHGLLVEPNNVDDMINAILSLFKDLEIREQLILNARALAESFDWEQVKCEWKKVLGL